MATLAPALRRSLTATEYLDDDGQPAAATVTVTNGKPSRRGSFQPDAFWWHDNHGIYFKHAPNTSRVEISVWQQEVWNEGSMPLLWLTKSDRTELYNGFALPKGPDAGTANRLHVFKHGYSSSRSALPAKGLAELNALAGRLSMETGRFWHQEKRVNRNNTVDRRLLQDLAALQDSLLDAGLEMDAAQGLIGRSIFAKYLADRQVISQRQIGRWGCQTFQQALRNSEAASTLFEWLVNRVNGDMFPSTTRTPSTRYLAKVADFLDGVDLRTGQQSLFPYRFDLIPVELISSIYEQFVHSAAKSGRSGNAKRTGVYYTPLALVSLILDRIMGEVTGDETVLDITCGSGIFLVEALRRLVRAKTGAGETTRAAIRKVLYEQVYGVDISRAAIRVAAFSLYLAALELERDPVSARGMKFRPIIGRTLLVGNAHDTHVAPSTSAASRRPADGFDFIVGNPPFTEKCDRSKMRKTHNAKPPRDRSLVFAERAWRFAQDGGRFGMVLKATPFFSRHDGKVAAQNIVDSLGPATLVNLSSCASWLFRSANAPVVALLAGHRKGQPAKHLEIVQAQWSPAGPRAHAFDITPGDVATLHTDSWKRNGHLFKAVCFGSYDDMMLLERMRNTLTPLSSYLQDMNATFNVGLILGRNGKNDARHLSGLPTLRRNGLRSFATRGEHLPFSAPKAHRPRERDIYNSPLLVVQEFLDDGNGTPRAIVANLEQDVVFTNAFYGASLPKEQAQTGHLLAGVLSSAVASWYFFMAGSTFGIDKRRVLQEDVAALPFPNVGSATTSRAKEKVVALAMALVAEAPTEAQWKELDEAVFDLYALDEQERQVVRDGVFRASWQWKHGRLASIAPVSSDELARYAHAFLSSFKPWIPDDRALQMRAEIYRPTKHPLRVVRFLLDDDFRLPTVDFIDASSGPSSGGMEDAIERAGTRFDGSPALSVGDRSEVEITAEGDVLIVKPSVRRHWLCSAAFADARAVLARARVPDRHDDPATAPAPRDKPAQDEEVALRYAVGYRDLAQLDADLEGWADVGVWPED